MAFMPYIHFSGTCAEAMAFYADVFGGTDMMMMRYDEAPAGQGGADSDRIIHAQFTAGGTMLMASDFPPGMAEMQQAMNVMTDPATVPEGKRVFDRLADGGAVIVPFGPAFWSPGFGRLKDRFGTHWIIGAQPESAPSPWPLQETLPCWTILESRSPTTRRPGPFMMRQRPRWGLQC